VYATCLARDSRIVTHEYWIFFFYWVYMCLCIYTHKLSFGCNIRNTTRLAGQVVKRRTAVHTILQLCEDPAFESQAGLFFLLFCSF
jgi:hypothetical protein